MFTFALSSLIVAVILKLGVWVVSPQSPNSLLRALVTGVVASVGQPAGAILRLAIHPVVAVAAAVCVPLFVVKVSSG
jgi:hypothetical protein